MLSYPKYLLKDNNINITNDNLFDIDIKKYDSILFSEVIMQLENFDSIIEFIINNNPNISIIVNHTIFNPMVSKLLTPIKNGVLKHIPIMNVGYGKALTYQQTIQMFTKFNCSLIYCLSKSVNLTSPLAALINKANAFLVSLPSCLTALIKSFIS